MNNTKSNTKIIYQFFFFLSLTSIFFFLACSKNNESKILIRRYVVMGGSILEFKLYDNGDKEKKAIKLAYQKVAEVDAECNIYKPESELSKLNKIAADKPFKCSPLLWDLLKISQKYYKMTDGSFDISSGPLIKLWGFHRKNKILPSEEKLSKIKKLIGLDKVIFNDLDKTVKFTVKGIQLDLGGIAKGYAVQLAADELKKQGITSGIINLAGNAYCFPKPPQDKNFYTIGIRHPLLKETVCGVVNILKQSIATSGNYERFVVINGHKYTHIMDPASCKPVEDMLSVTVVTPNATDADALSTSIFIKGASFAEKICEQIPGTAVLIINRDKDSDKVKTVKIVSSIYPKGTTADFSDILIED
jgi:thiamine biosynthesis lipoprotein